MCGFRMGEAATNSRNTTNDSIAVNAIKAFLQCNDVRHARSEYGRSLRCDRLHDYGALTNFYSLVATVETLRLANWSIERQFTGGSDGDRRECEKAINNIIRRHAKRERVVERRGDRMQQCTVRERSIAIEFVNIQWKGNYIAREQCVAFDCTICTLLRTHLFVSCIQSSLWEMHYRKFAILCALWLHKLVCIAAFGWPASMHWYCYRKWAKKSEHDSRTSALFHCISPSTGSIRFFSPFYSGYSVRNTFPILRRSGSLRFASIESRGRSVWARVCVPTTVRVSSGVRAAVKKSETHKKRQWHSVTHGWAFVKREKIEKCANGKWILRNDEDELKKCILARSCLHISLFPFDRRSADKVSHFGERTGTRYT